MYGPVGVALCIGSVVKAGVDKTGGGRSKRSIRQVEERREVGVQQVLDGTRR